jgi:hypothetical protein
MVWSRFSRLLFILNSLLAAAESHRPLLCCHGAEGILLINLFESGKDLCVCFLA